MFYTYRDCERKPISEKKIAPSPQSVLAFGSAYKAYGR